MEAPTAFETVGHIAHLNLKADQLAYKHAIGQVSSYSCVPTDMQARERSDTWKTAFVQVLIDKNPSIRTVVNKVPICIKP